MDAEKLEVLKNKEKAIYNQEVASAQEPRLHLLLVHLYIEHLLERYIETKLKKPSGLFGERGLTFEKKIVLARSFGEVGAQLVDAILKVNNLRNDLVHKFRHSLSPKQIDDLGRTFGRAYKGMKAKNGDDDAKLLRAYCSYLCGAMLRIVVEAENGSA